MSDLESLTRSIHCSLSEAYDKYRWLLIDCNEVSRCSIIDCYDTSTFPNLPRFKCSIYLYDTGDIKVWNHVSGDINRCELEDPSFLEYVIGLIRPVLEC